MNNHNSGQTTLTCRTCGSKITISNSCMEGITEFQCAVCGFHMTDREIAFMKMHYYLLLTQAYNEFCGPKVDFFSYEINLFADNAGDLLITEDNGNSEGGSA